MKNELSNIKNFEYNIKTIKPSEKQWDLAQTQNKFYQPKGLDFRDNEQSLKKKLSKLSEVNKNIYKFIY